VSFADRIRAAQEFDARRCLPFRIAAAHCGWLRHAFASELKRWPEVFAVAADAVAILDNLDTPIKRSAALPPVLLTLRDEGAIIGWRDEAYAVAAEFDGPPLLTIERAAAHPFGVRTHAAHLNGYVGAGRDCRMWIARRAATKSIEPSMLDTLVGGGIGAGFTPRQTLLKECDEEAGMTLALAQHAKPGSNLISMHEVADGVHWEMLHAFDLDVGEDFEPENRDGEVAEFHLLPIAEICRLVRDTAEFTADAALVILDFLLRHDLADVADEERDALASAIRGAARKQPC
jgi:8-oxo-dGTP pyrophosphatase MutT (NUDIX family)